MADLGDVIVAAIGAFAGDSGGGSALPAVAVTAGAAAAGALPFGSATMAPESCPGVHWIYDTRLRNGQIIGWRILKRRRRRSLATEGNLRDLAALKAVLGKGTAFTTWIATHPC